MKYDPVTSVVNIRLCDPFVSDYSKMKKSDLFQVSTAVDIPRATRN